MMFGVVVLFGVLVMRRFNNIFMVYNPNQQTLARAVRLALENGARQPSILIHGIKPKLC